MLNYFFTQIPVLWCIRFQSVCCCTPWLTQRKFIKLYSKIGCIESWLMFANKYSNGGLIFCFYLCLQHPRYLGNCDPCRIHQGVPFIEIGKKINCCKRRIVTTTFTESTDDLRKYICFLRLQGSVKKSSHRLCYTIFHLKGFESVIITVSKT